MFRKRISHTGGLLQRYLGCGSDTIERADILTLESLEMGSFWMNTTKIQDNNGHLESQIKLSIAQLSIRSSSEKMKVVEDPS